MSSKKGKKTKKVSQNDLRKMMSEVKNKRTTSAPQVVKNKKDNRTLASDSNAYKKALNDRMKLQALISESTDPTQKKEPVKHKNDSNNSKPLKSSLKRPLPSKTQNSNSTVDTNKGRSSKMAKTDPVAKEKGVKPGGLLVGDYSSDSDDDKGDKSTQEDDEKMETDSPAPPEQTDPSAALPEGFFDDAEVDAKMRGVETPADAMDREWEEFQKEIQRETGQSEQIVVEEQEIGNVDRQLEEIDEQIMHFTRVEKLNVVKDEIKRKPKKQKESESDESASGSEDADDMLDWREKDSHF